VLKKIINILRGNRTFRDDHKLYWTGADLEASLNEVPTDIRRDMHAPISMRHNNKTLTQALVLDPHGWTVQLLRGVCSDYSFERMSPEYREKYLNEMIAGIAVRASWVGDIRLANMRLAQLFEIHMKASQYERNRAEDSEKDAVSTVIIRMLEIDKDNLLEEQAMFTESEWKARAKAIDDGEIDIETLRHNELEASVAVPYTGEEDLKGLPYDVLQEMLAEYRHKAMIVGHMKATYRHDDYTVFISKDGIQVEHENIVQFNGAA